MMKVLVVIVNYEDEQLEYLEKMVRMFKSFEKFNVTIIVNSNINIDINGIDKVNIIELNDYQLLPLTCRKTIWENRNIYDLFIYSENDHLFFENHLDKHLEYSNLLPKKYLPGLIQYEELNGKKYYPGYHNDFDWDIKSVVKYDDKIFAHFNNVHQASFILTKNQLKRVSNKINFTRLKEYNKLEYLFYRIFKKDKLKKKYSDKCKVNTDIYEFGGMKKVICISEFNENLIHHLPNIYINGEKGRKKLRSEQDKMDAALKKMLS